MQQERYMYEMLNDKHNRRVCFGVTIHIEEQY